MKLIQSLVFGSLLLASSAYAEGFGFSVGPFSLQFGVRDGGYATDRVVILDNPICYAISNQMRLEIIVEGKEVVNSKELKIVTKKLLVEPYAFGVSKNNPILNGNVVEEKLIKEVVVKYGEDQFEEKNVSVDQKGKGFFSGWFRSNKSQEKVQSVDIRKVSDLRVLEDSHFDAPKNYGGMKDENVQVICQLPITS